MTPTVHDNPQEFSAHVSRIHALEDEVERLKCENDKLRDQVHKLHELLTALRSVSTVALTYIDSHLMRE